MHAALRRHPITRRFARSVADTVDDPRAWWEGPAEPTRLAGVQPWQPRSAVRRWPAACIALAIVLLLIGVAS